MSSVLQCPHAPDATRETSGAPASARRRQAPLSTHHGNRSGRELVMLRLGLLEPRETWGAGMAPARRVGLLRMLQ